MSTFNRRQWLKTAGLSSTFSLFGGLSLSANNTRVLPMENSATGEYAQLSSNENPFGPSKKVREAMIQAFDKGCRYPYYYQQELVELIAQKHGVQPEHVLVTGGSREALKITGLAFGLYGGEIITALPTYKAMTSYAAQFTAHINNVPLNDALEYDLNEIERRISNNTKLIFLCNPNNPTGTLLDKNKLREFVDAASDRTMVFSDEAYYDYITEPDYPSMVELVKEGKNVIV
ncbi:MAG: aminotransferase class I/II-fold pyridoxal phosphate-dependent enzyme, partial [Bacteroidota bacterium]